MSLLKQSRFLASFDLDEEKTILVSNLTNAICVVDKEAYDLLQRFKEPSPEDALVEDPKVAELISELKKAGILIDVGTSELELFEKKIKRKRKETMYTFVLTYDCNLRCNYCYEGEKQPYNMSWETAQTILDFISRRTKERGDSRINIGFYGGEPLLQKELMFKILKLAENLLPKGVKLSTGMPTNGTLLTDNVVEVLERYNCESIQITIDGPPDIHNKRRPTASGHGTFDEIIAGARRIIGKFPLALRINIDKDNMPHIPRFIHLLRSLGFNRPDVIIMPSPVLTTTSACKDYAPYCLPSLKYAKMILKYITMFSEEGFNVFWREARPSPLYCEALGENARLIFDCSGDIYTCLAGLRRKEYLVGNIFNKPPIDERLFEKWRKRSPLQFPECMACDIVGFCGAGCLDEAFDAHGTFNAVHCPYFFYNYRDTVREYVRWKLKYPSRWRRGVPSRLYGDIDVK